VLIRAPEERAIRSVRTLTWEGSRWK